ncbi:MAG: sensor histidine kinase, partial [Clostridia bacterium]|nr:sensor histidine kinase [Clostridia bacterium]
MNDVDGDLSTRADEVAAAMHVVELAPIGLIQVVLPDVDVFAAPDTYVQVVDRSGEVRARSASLGNRSLPVPAPGDAWSGSTRTVAVDGRPLRLHVRPLVVEGHVVGYLEVARPLETVRGALARLRRLLLG